MWECFVMESFHANHRVRSLLNLLSCYFSHSYCGICVCAARARTCLCGACVRARVRVSARACVCESPRARVCAREYVCLRAHVCASVCVCARASARMFHCMASPQTIDTSTGVYFENFLLLNKLMPWEATIAKSIVTSWNYLMKFSLSIDWLEALQR